MGRIKELSIELRNQEMENQLEPPPDEIDLNTNKNMWVINGYRIWAKSYMEALELLPMIESF
jgi:hypothetical protein